MQKKLLSSVHSWRQRHLPFTKRQSNRSPSRESNHPIHHIPYEVLEIILNFAVRDWCKCGGATCSDSGKVPLAEGYIYFDSRHRSFWPPDRRRLLLMTSVCSYWRKTIIDSPSLWSRIELAALTPELLDLWMRRSKNVPLDVFIAIPADPAAILASDSFLREYMDRIKRISVSNYGYSQFILPDVPAPLLKTLSIEVIRTGVTLGQNGLNLDAPGLEDLCLKGVTASPPLNSLAYVQKLSLTGWDAHENDGWSLDRIIQIITQCCNTIVELEVDTTKSSEVVSTGKILTLPRLRRLVWSTRNIPIVSSQNLFEFIAAPVIQTLHINIPLYGDSDFLILPMKFIQLSERAPKVVDLYYKDVRAALGMNFYADFARKKKILAFLWSGIFSSKIGEFIESFPKTQNLVTLTHARVAFSNLGWGLREAQEWLPDVKVTDNWDMNEI